MLGEKIYTASNIQPQMQVAISSYSKDVYFVKVYAGAKVYNQKIVVQ